MDGVKTFLITFYNKIFDETRKYTLSDASYNLVQARVKRCQKQIDLLIDKDNILYNIWNDLKNAQFGNIESVDKKLLILQDINLHGNRDNTDDIIKMIETYGFMLLFSNFVNYILAISQRLDDSIEYWRTIKRKRSRRYWYFFEKYPIYSYHIFLNKIDPTKECIKNIFILKKLKEKLNYFLGGFNLIVGTKSLNDGNLFQQLFNLWNNFQHDLKFTEVINEDDWSSDEENIISHRMSTYHGENSQYVDQHESNLMDINEIILSIEKVKKYTLNIIDEYGSPTFFEKNWIFIASAIGFSFYAFRCYDFYVNLAVKYFYISKRSIERFTKEHLFEPLKNIVNIIRYDKQNDSESIQSSIDGNTLSLVRMVHDYAIDKNTPPDEIDTILEQSGQNNINYIMKMYEKEVRSPIKNALVGDLMRLVLIQVQKQKIDVEKVMMNINVLLKQNEINFQIMAAFPVVIILVLLSNYLTKKQSPRRYHYSIRNNMRSLSILINRGKQKTDGYNIQFEDYGQLLIYMHRLYNLCFKMKDSPEKFMFFDDLKEIETEEFDANQRLTTLQRMTLSYGFLKGDEST